jgi:mannose/fructose/N-acetylgalactosamine-specific phosphotransferase system component IID
MAHLNVLDAITSGKYVVNILQRQANSFDALPRLLGLFLTLIWVWTFDQKHSKLLVIGGLLGVVGFSDSLATAITKVQHC